MHNMGLLLIYLLFGSKLMGLIDLNYIICFVLHVQYHRNIVASMKDDYLMQQVIYIMVHLALNPKCVYDLVSFTKFLVIFDTKKCACKCVIVSANIFEELY